MESEDLLRATYAAFNARDIEGALHAMTPDVDWPNAWEGGRVTGHAGVRDYWIRQWAAIDSKVDPVSFRSLSDGRVAVLVDQVARSLDGTVLGQGPVVHVYRLRDGLIARMDVEEPDGG